MSSTQEFERYLGLFRLRLKQLALARGLGLVALAALAVTAAAVFLAVRQGFPDGLVIGSRLILLAVIALLVYRFMLRPGRHIDADGSAEIEARAPEFAGRVTTWKAIRGTDNPVAELLAEDALRLAAGHPPERAVPQKEFSLALGVAGGALLLLLFLGVAGPGNYAYGVRHLWFGWAFPGLLPPQNIAVSPGDDGIRLGGTVNVRAEMQGFDPSRAWVHARFGEQEWQQVEMANLDRNFEFTFFSVREPLEYYVSAANVRSPTFSIAVVDLPVVENLAVTYRFPEWTQRADETQDPGGDVRAISDTEIEIRVTTDRPMTPGELVIDDLAIPLDLDGNNATASFTLRQDGQYFVAAKVGGEQIRLTDDYFLTVLDDAIPQIEFARPGRDWSASSIEEVTARVSARDDFRLESLELRYTVNGGQWQSIPMPVDSSAVEIDHVFFLEALSDRIDGENLVPGDLISYYAVATDRDSEARTDMFFIDVQPFDRRYSQSQQAGGQMGGQQGQRQDEISQRQREIIISTWNLIREQQEGRRSDPAYVTDNASLLARVQSTLREQVETLARRTEARQLTASAEDIARFVEHLEKAAAAMLPATERLEKLALEEAILPEQEALQHLLAAEAVFTDISVSLQSNSRGGRGGQAGRDLTEMFELEMDLEKNQYETGSRASPDAPQQAMEEAVNELEDLARRQEQLARNMNRNQQPTPAQRWQQEMLRRDVEELRQRLERLERQSAANQSQDGDGGQGQASASGESAGSEERRRLDELQRRLESAVRAMNEADEAMRDGGSPDDLQRAAQEARRQLEGARDRASEEVQRGLQASVDELATRADDLYASQQAMEDRLMEAIRGVNVGRNDDDRLDSGMSIVEEYELADEKRRLQGDVQKLEQDARNAAQQMAESQPRSAEAIREAIERLRETEIESRLAIAAAYIEQGEAVYIVNSEGAVTDALRELSEDLERASGLTRSRQAGEGGQETEGRSLAETLSRTRELRRQLERVTEGAPGGGRLADTGRDDLQSPTGIEIGGIDVGREYDDRADSLSDDVVALFRDFRGRGVAVQDIDQLRRLAADIRAHQFSGNPALLEEEARRALSLVEQLELALTRSARGPSGSVRTTAADEVPQEHRQVVADYYRRLGETGDEEPE